MNPVDNNELLAEFPEEGTKDNNDEEYATEILMDEWGSDAVDLQIDADKENN